MRIVDLQSVVGHLFFDVILADPPWRYDFSKSNSRKVENQYPTMTTEEICDLEVPAAKNSVLYLWGTAPKLLDACDVMKAWGFNYVTNMVWDKQVMGMGHWSRVQHEHLLIGKKGKFSPPPVDLRVPSVIVAKRGKHSAKPALLHELITKWWPQARRLELFARETRPGWSHWGNEV